MSSIRIHIKSTFFCEKQPAGCDLIVIERKHTHGYAEEQNCQSVPAGCFAVERGF